VLLQRVPEEVACRKMVRFTDTADSRILENVCPSLDASGQIRLGT
jgi:hypothetical protein